MNLYFIGIQIYPVIVKKSRNVSRMSNFGNEILREKINQKGQKRERGPRRFDNLEHPLVSGSNNIICYYIRKTQLKFCAEERRGSFQN